MYTVCWSPLLFRKKWNILHFHWQNELNVIFKPNCISVTGLLLVTRLTINYMFMITSKWFDNSTSWLISGSAMIKLLSSEYRRDVNTAWILSGRSLVYKRKRSKPWTWPSHSPCLTTVRITVRLKLNIFVRMLSHSFTRT
jgi:hypothetical protein